MITIDWENQGRLWARPAAAGLLALGAGYLLSVLLGAILAAIGGQSNGSPGDYLRLGGFILLVTQHVSLVGTVPSNAADTSHISTTFAPLGFTLVIVALAFVAGSRATPPGATSWRQAGWTGLRLSFAYGFGSLLLCLVTRVSTPDGTFGASVAGSLFIPFVWTLAAGSAGAFRSIVGTGVVGVATGRLERSLPQIRPAANGAKAGLRAAVAVETLALVLIIIVASIMHPSAAKDFFTSPRDVLALILLLVLCLPNWMGLGLAAAMGASLQLTVNASAAFGVVSVGLFGASGRVEGIGGGTANIPAYWLFALLVPASILLYAGYEAAATSTGNARDQTMSGAMAGGLITALVWVTVGLAGVTVRSDLVIPFNFALKASTVGILLLPPLWGVVGGVIGAQIYVSRQAPRSGIYGADQAPPQSVAAWGTPDRPVAPPPAREQRWDLVPPQPDEEAFRPPVQDPVPQPPPQQSWWDDQATAVRPVSGQAIPPDARVYCTYCGASNMSRHRFCENCGRPMEHTPVQS